MDKINVQLLFTKEEFDHLQVEADKVGLTVPLYIKGEVLKDDDFGSYYKKLIEKVDVLPSGTKFNIKALFGVEWTMSKGIKLNLGKTFYGRVDSRIVDNVLKIGKDSSNVMWYEKK
ncbi:MAG: single-stranded DNA-binding protein [Suipraeoptans sp.]